MSMPDSQIDISKHQFERNKKIFLKETISGIGWNVFRITQAVFDWEIWRGIHSSKSSQCYNWSTAFNISDWLSFGRYRCWDLLSQLISQHLNLLILISKNLIWPILTKLTKLMQQQEGNFQGVKTSPEDQVYCWDPRQKRDKKDEVITLEQQNVLFQTKTQAQRQKSI